MEMPGAVRSAERVSLASGGRDPVIIRDIRRDAHVAPSAGRSACSKVTCQPPVGSVSTVGRAVPSTLSVTVCPSPTRSVLPEMVTSPPLSSALMILSPVMSSMVIEGPLKSALMVLVAGVVAGLQRRR